MIPSNNILIEEITETQYPGKTYKININVNKEEPQTDKISGYIDDLEAVKQTIYLILNTERYEYLIYSWDYGVELLDLIGQPIPYVMAEIPRRITEALTMDNRIEDVVDFNFEIKRNKLHTTFTVITKYGNLDTSLEVTI